MVECLLSAKLPEAFWSYKGAINIWMLENSILTGGDLKTKLSVCVIKFVSVRSHLWI